MNVIKGLMCGTGGALVAWHMSQYQSSGPTSLLGCLLFFNVISLVAALMKSK